MSTLTIDANAKPIQVLRPTTVSVVSLSGSAASAPATAAGIRVARIVSDTDCFYSVTGTATTSSSYLPANQRLKSLPQVRKSPTDRQAKLRTEVPV